MSNLTKAQQLMENLGNKVQAEKETAKDTTWGFLNIKVNLSGQVMPLFHVTDYVVINPEHESKMYGAIHKRLINLFNKTEGCVGGNPAVKDLVLPVKMTISKFSANEDVLNEIAALTGAKPAAQPAKQKNTHIVKYSLCIGGKDVPAFDVKCFSLLNPRTEKNETCKLLQQAAIELCSNAGDPADGLTLPETFKLVFRMVKSSPVVENEEAAVNTALTMPSAQPADDAIEAEKAEEARLARNKRARDSRAAKKIAEAEMQKEKQRQAQIALLESQLN